MTSWINNLIKTLGPQANYNGVTSGIAVSVGKIESSLSDPTGTGVFTEYTLTIMISPPSG